MSSSNSEDEFSSTPPNIVQLAANTTENLLPEKSRGRYEKVYQQFMDWRTTNNVNSFSENVLLAYFGEIAKKFKPSSLWAIYSMLRSVITLKNNVNIENYPKLRAYLKRQSEGFKNKKSKILHPDEIKTFLNGAPDVQYLLIKVCYLKV